MSEINAPATLVTPAGTITFNPAGPVAEYYWFNDVSGLDGVGLRTPIDKKGLADGANVHPFLKDPRHVTITGLVVFIAAASRNTMCDALVSALSSIEKVDGTYSWTPTGQATKSLTVRCDLNIEKFTGTGMSPKEFLFGLVAGNPTIT